MSETLTKTPAHHTNLAVGLQTVPSIRDEIHLPITGQLPDYLGTNTLYRIGPGRFEAKHNDGKPYEIRHWFDGLSLLHAFRLHASDNTVHYRSNFFDTGIDRAVQSVSRTDWSAYSFSSPDPCRGIFGRLFQLFSPITPDPTTGKPPIPNVSVTVQQIPGKGLVARTDSTSTIVIDEQTLDIQRYFTLGGSDYPQLSGNMSAAHGIYDNDTHEYFNFIFKLGLSAMVDYSIFAIGRDGNAKTLATFQAPPSYLHSFALTAKYFILIMWPLRLSGKTTFFSHSLLSGAWFEKSQPTRFMVISREHGNVVAEFHSEAFFCFHTVNAYDDEDDDAIVIDLCRYEDDTILHDLHLERMRREGINAHSTFTRYKLPNISVAREEYNTSTNEQTPQRQAQRIDLNENEFELATIHPNRQRRNYRFAYGVSSQDGLAFNVVAKVDVYTGKRMTWGTGRIIVGEPIFVPDPNGENEDDGCLLTVVLDACAQRSRLVVLDSKTLEVMAEAQVPQVVPLGFHGMVRPSGVNLAT